MFVEILGKAGNDGPRFSPNQARPQAGFRSRGLVWMEAFHLDEVKRVRSVAVNAPGPFPTTCQHREAGRSGSGREGSAAKTGDAEHAERGVIALLGENRRWGGRGWKKG